MAKAGEIVAKLKLNVNEYQEGMQKAKDELNDFSDTTKAVSKFAVGALATIVTAMAGVAVASGKMAVEQEKQLSKLQAQTGATAEEMEDMKKHADNLFLGGRGSYEDIYDTLSQVKTVLGHTGDEAERSAKSALLLSDIYGYDVSESLRAVSSAQKAWGEDSEITFDMITKLSQTAGDKADDLLDTFWEYAPVMAEAGFSAMEFGDILSAGMDAGAFNFDKIGDAMKEFNVRLTDGSTQTEELSEKLFGSKRASDAFFASVSSGDMKGGQAMQKIVSLLHEIEDPIERNTMGVAYFGTMWEDLGGDVVMAMGMSDGALGDFIDSTHNAGVALDDNIGTKIDAIKNQFVVWSRDLGNSFLPSIERVVDYITEKMPSILSTLTNVFGGAGKVLSGFIDGGLAVVEFLDRNSKAVGILAKIIGAVLLPSLIGWITHTTILKGKALIGLIGSTVKTMLANYKLGLSYVALHGKALLAMGIFGLIVAVGILIWKNWDKIVAVFAKWGITSESVSKVIENLKNRMLEMWNAFKESSFVQGTIDLFGSLGDKIKGLGASMSTIPKHLSNMKDRFSDFKDSVSNSLSGVTDSVSNSLGGVGISFGSIGGMIGGYVGKIIDSITQVVDGFKTLISSGDFTPLINAIANLFPMIIGFFLKGNIGMMYSGMRIISSIAEGMGISIPELITKVTDTIVSVIEQFAEALPMYIEIGIEMLEKLIEGFISALPMIIDALIVLIEMFTTIIADLLPVIVDVGMNILLALLGGLLSALPQLLEAWMTIFGAFIGIIGTLLPVILSVGIKVIMALVEGLIGAMPSIMSAGGTLIGSLLSAILGMLPTILDAGIKLILALLDGILSILPQLISAGIKLIISLLTAVLGMLPKIISAGIQILLALIKGIISILPQLISAGLQLIFAIIGALIGSLPQILSAGVQILWALIKGILSILPQLISAGLQIIGVILKALIGAIPKILSAGVQLIVALVKGLLSMIGSVGSAIGQIGSRILSAVKNISLVNIGKDMIKGLWNGISSVGGWIQGKIGGFMGNITGGIKKFFGIKSPSRLFRDEIGTMLMKGLEVGIEVSQKNPVKAMANVAGNIVDGVGSIMGAYDNLSNVQIATPDVGIVDVGIVGVGQVRQSGNGGEGTNYNAPLVQVETMNVTDESDARNVSRELFNLQRNHDRAKGGR